MLRISQIKVPVGATDEKRSLEEKLAKIFRHSDAPKTFKIVRRALDARKAPELYWIYTVDVAVNNEDRYLSGKNNDICRAPKPFNPVLNIKRSNKFRPIVVGFGPAGIFAGYILALNGQKPIIFERGYDMDKRKVAVDSYWNDGLLNPISNVQFGEGGAGAFSDGKLNTSVKDKDQIGRFVLETFVKYGANPDILLDAKPHVGTDKLAIVIPAIRNAILDLGGEIHFESQVTSITEDNGQITSVVVNDNEKYETSDVVLAIGHSARDTFRYLNSMAIPMIAKDFAVGFRVEHPQDIIDRALYKGAEKNHKLPPAAYKLTHQATTGRAVYSFCMCPGGHVVNASSYDGGTAVNGMSYMARDSKVANSAIVVSVGKNDYEDEGPLAAISFQEKIEKKCFSIGKGAVPRQMLGDFRKGIVSTGYTGFRGALKGRECFADMSKLYTNDITNSFLEGMSNFEHKIQGFNDESTILSGIESRTSSPVRITRDEFFQSTLRGLYPCGEGAGYAGGIMSAAMDGIKVALKILESRK